MRCAEQNYSTDIGQKQIKYTERWKVMGLAWTQVEEASHLLALSSATASI